MLVSIILKSKSILLELIWNVFKKKLSDKIKIRYVLKVFTLSDVDHDYIFTTDTTSFKMQFMQNLFLA